MQAVIWTKKQCTHCEAAKRLMQMKHIPYQEKSIDENRDSFIEQYPHVRMAPLILIDGKEVGGFDKLRNFIDENKL